MKLLKLALACLFALGLLVVGFLVAWIVIAVALAAGMVIWGWLWWKTRALRRAAARGQASVIEGEFYVEAPAALQDRAEHTHPR
jgi:hypothetical protein